MNKRLLSLVASACILPLTAHAELQSITFNLLNDYASVVNPLTVTGGYVTFFGCTSNQLTTLPLAPVIQVGTSSATPISVPITSDLTSCLQDPMSVNNVALYITQVDGKNKQGDQPYCLFYMGVTSKSVNPQITIDIRETDDTFNCSQLQSRQ